VVGFEAGSMSKKTRDAVVGIIAGIVFGCGSVVLAFIAAYYLIDHM
jgi:hypothetical protein